MTSSIDRQAIFHGDGLQVSLQPPLVIVNHQLTMSEDIQWGATILMEEGDHQLTMSEDIQWGATILMKEGDHQLTMSGDIQWGATILMEEGEADLLILD